MSRKKGTASAGPAKPVEEHVRLIKEIWRKKGVLQRHLQHSTIDERNHKGATLLHVACSDTKSFAGSSDALVKQLLRAGADCNLASTLEGFTPLMLATTADIASCLLDNGADIGSECHEGCTALHLACKCGHLGVAGVLLKGGAEQHILKSSKDGATPLSAAFVAGELDIIMLLLQHLLAQADFDINHPTLVLDQPVVCTAAEAGMCRVVEAALDHGAFINATGPDGTALQLAARAGHYNTVSLLCERGADVNARGGSMQISSLEAAVFAERVRILKKLIKHGADMNAVSEKTQTSAVVQAALLGKCAALAVLLQAGAHFDAALQYKSFNCAIWHLDDATAAEVVKVLLPHCSNLNEPDAATGHTALTYALSQSKLQAARALCAAGADVHFRLSYGTTAHVAAQFSSVAVLKWLQSVGVDLRGVNEGLELPLHYACNSNRVDAARYLLDLPDAAGDVHARSASQQTPLYYAAFTGAENATQLLLQRGAAVDVRCVGGSTPLMVAKTAPVVKLLLAAGADAAAVTHAGSTALHSCATFGATAGAVCLLLKAGADPTAVDNNGSAAAHVAGMKGHFGLEALLSRAADDYRKKQAASSSSSNSSSSSADSSSSSSSSSDISSTPLSTVIDDSSVDSSASSTAATGTDEHSTHEQQADALHDAVTAEQQQQQRQPQVQKAKQPCANCSKLTAKRCRRCAAVYYCSVECQKVCFADTQHRAQCEAAAAEVV
jgi:uncharacterized protein